MKEGHVLPEHPLEVPFAQDQQMIQALLPCRPLCWPLGSSGHLRAAADVTWRHARCKTLRIGIASVLAVPVRGHVLQK